MDKTNFRKYESYESRYEGGRHVWEYVYSISEDDKTVSYGDIKPDSEGSYIEVPYTTYSDYSGGTVERANCDEFLRLFGELAGVWELAGGHGTRGVLISRALYESNDEVKETIDSLDNYPLINDESLSNLEMELESESWESWVKFDLTRALESAELDFPESDSEFESLFWYVIRKNDINSKFENAVSCYWDIEDIVNVWPSPLPHFYKCPNCESTYDTLREHCKCQIKMF